MAISKKSLRNGKDLIFLYLFIQLPLVISAYQKGIFIFNFYDPVQNPCAVISPVEDDISPLQRFIPYLHHLHTALSPRRRGHILVPVTGTMA